MSGRDKSNPVFDFHATSVEAGLICSYSPFSMEIKVSGRNSAEAEAEAAPSHFIYKLQVKTKHSPLAVKVFLNKIYFLLI